MHVGVVALDKEAVVAVFGVIEHSHRKTCGRRQRNWVTVDVVAVAVHQIHFGGGVEEHLQLAISVVINLLHTADNRFVDMFFPHYPAGRIDEVDVVAQVLNEDFLLAGIVVVDQHGLEGGKRVKVRFPERRSAVQLRRLMAQEGVVVEKPFFRRKLPNQAVEVAIGRLIVVETVDVGGRQNAAQQRLGARQRHKGVEVRLVGDVIAKLVVIRVVVQIFVQHIVVHKVRNHGVGVAKHQHIVDGAHKLRLALPHPRAKQPRGRLQERHLVDEIFGIVVDFEFLPAGACCFAAGQNLEHLPGLVAAFGLNHAHRRAVGHCHLHHAVPEIVGHLTDNLIAEGLFE